ncbi:hypothetical protein [Winogradskyella sp.]|uniref:hypothetical protein n=1 Tax=Winogradskyella sp. TaxID=1883156 RepID=UPI003F6958C7
MAPSPKSGLKIKLPPMSPVIFAVAPLQLASKVKEASSGGIKFAFTAILVTETQPFDKLTASAK